MKINYGVGGDEGFMELVIGYSVNIILILLLLFGIVICRKGLSIDNFFYSGIMWFLILMTVGTVYQLIIPSIVSKMIDSYITNGEPIANYIYYLQTVDKLLFLIAIVLLLISLRHKLRASRGS